jgi:hypothetical protein
MVVDCQGNGASLTECRGSSGADAWPEPRRLGCHIVICTGAGAENFEDLDLIFSTPSHRLMPGGSALGYRLDSVVYTKG